MTWGPELGVVLFSPLRLYNVTKAAQLQNNAGLVQRVSTHVHVRTLEQVHSHQGKLSENTCTGRANASTLPGYFSQRVFPGARCFLLATILSCSVISQWALCESVAVEPAGLKWVCMLASIPLALACSRTECCVIIGSEGNLWTEKKTLTAFYLKAQCVRFSICNLMVRKHTADDTNVPLGLIPAPRACCGLLLMVVEVDLLCM